MRILAIETSCDETAISKIVASGGIKKPSFEVIANAVSSQINIHRPFGGVVPNLAKREHERNLPILLEGIMKQGARSKEQGHDSRFMIHASDIDLIAITVGPGLEPALWAGIEFAKSLAKEWKKPIIGVSHMEGHLYSFLLPSAKKTAKYEQITNCKLPTAKVYPAIVLLVSGGHTILLRLDSLTKWKKLGETLDDAVGEAFDKVARLLELPYPGGPEIEKVAKKGNENAIDFPRPMLNQKNYNFSFSGLKTSVLYHLRDSYPFDKPKERENIAASFQNAAVEVLVKKTARAVEEFGAKSVILAGGVAANKYLRAKLKKAAEELDAQFFCPELEYNTDNATMIAAAAYINYVKSEKFKVKIEEYEIVGELPLEANGNLGI